LTISFGVLEEQLREKRRYLPEDFRYYCNLSLFLVLSCLVTQKEKKMEKIISLLKKRNISVYKTPKKESFSNRDHFLF